MDLSLNEKQGALLREILDRAYRDLSYEIADTDSSTFREQLRSQRDELKSLLDAVGGPLPDAEPSS
jgi:hypothetical protein